MLVTALPAAAKTAMLQLNLVPVSPRESRITQSSGVSGATSTECRTPFTVRSTAIAFPRYSTIPERLSGEIDGGARNADPGLLRQQLERPERAAHWHMRDVGIELA